MLRRALLAGLLGVASCARAPDDDAPPLDYRPQSENDAFLDGLVGDWIMEGAVEGEAVRYRARGERVLRGPWFAFHMIDVSAPPQYEATVFISVDAKVNDYVVHWLDSSGGAGARVVGRGRREAEALRFDFPYIDGAVRNVWTKSDNDWSLLIENLQPDGLWTTFAHYDIRRPT